jgi:chromate reductase
MGKLILAISGSLRATSSNAAILLAASELVPAGVHVKMYNGLDLLPHFNPDREKEMLPEVLRLRNEIKTSQALLICSPEYAHGIPGSLKNALDWIVGTGELDQLPVAIINATPMYESKSFAQESLIEILKTMSAKITPDILLYIPSVKSKLDSENKLNDSQTAVDIKKLLENLS